MRRSVVMLFAMVMVSIGGVHAQVGDGPDHNWYWRSGATLGALDPVDTGGDFPPLPADLPVLQPPPWDGATLDRYFDIRDAVLERMGDHEDDFVGFVRLLQRTGTSRSDEEGDPDETEAGEALRTCSLVGGGGTIIGEGGSGVLFADGGAGRVIGEGGAGTLFGDGGAVLQARPTAYFPDADVVYVEELALLHPPAREGLAHSTFAIIDRFMFDKLPWHERTFATREEALHGAEELALNAIEVVDGYSVVMHGHLVLHHMLQLVIGQASEGPITIVVSQIGASGAWRVDVSLPGNEVRIDLHNMYYATLEGLQSALGVLIDDDARIVMSWTLSNCALVDRYLAEGTVGSDDAPRADTRVESYAKFLIDLIGLAREGNEADLLHQLCLIMTDNADVCTDSFLLAVLLAFLEGRAESDVSELWFSSNRASLWSRVFAAAGNHRLPFPLPPASWPVVYGVAACSPTLPGNTWFTNRGDVVRDEHVLAPGAWYPVRTAMNGAAIGYWGTSFAAPYAALTLSSVDTGDGPHVLGMCEGTFVTPRYGPH
jgi:hypothetical protein